MLAVLVLAAGLLTPAYEVECGVSIQDAVEAGHAHLQLAGDCVYDERVVLGPKTTVRIAGAEGTVLDGQIVLTEVAEVSIEGLTLRHDGVSVLIRGGETVTLNDLRLEGSDGIQADGLSALRLHRVIIKASAGAALWADGVEQVIVTESVLSGATYAMVLRRLPGEARVEHSHLRARADSPAMAAVFVEGPGVARLSNNQIEYLTLRGGTARSVLDMDIKARLENNTVVGDGVGVRARRRIIMGCNQFSGTNRRVKGPYTRDCPTDLAPNRLSWQAKAGL